MYPFQIIKERLGLSEKGASLANATTRNSKFLTATSATTNRPSSPANTRLTIALRLRPTTRETPVLQPMPNAEKTSKSCLSTWQSSSQVKWATSTPRFKSSPSKHMHLLGSRSPLTFKVTKFTDQTHLPPGNPWGCGYRRRASEIRCRT